MKTIRKLLAVYMSLSMAVYVLPSFANTAEAATTTVLSDAALAGAIGGLGSLDATLANDYTDASPATAVVTNRTTGQASYALESTDASGNQVIVLASGTLAPGESRVISGTPPAGRNAVGWTIRARVFIPGIAGQLAQDTSMHN